MSLLGNFGMFIECIIEEVGYCDICSFRCVFKCWMGVSLVIFCSEGMSLLDQVFMLVV